MKTANLKQILLIAFAVIAVYTACMPGSVAVYDLTQSKEPFHCTYFTLVEGVTGNIFLPAAALCACLTLLLGGLYLARKNTRLLSWVKGLSMAGASLAVLPILMKEGSVMLLPNVLLPIALLCEYVAANYLKTKAEPQAVELKGRRL